MFENRKDLLCTSSLGGKKIKLILPCHFHKKVFEKKIAVSEKCNCFGQTLVFLACEKPGLYTSNLYFFL